MSKKIYLFILLLFHTSNGFAAPLWHALKEKVIAADLAVERKEQKQLAKEALAMAEACLKKKAGETGCLYYRAQAMGLANQGFIGYTTRLRAMFKDWEKVMKADPKFDYGGPYRMFAEVYMELPKHFGPKDLRQNLDKSLDYLKRAIAVSDYPTNYLDMAEVLLALERPKEAKENLEKAKKYLPLWSSYPYYNSWLNTLERLEKAASPDK